MGDEDELGLVPQALQHLPETIHVGLVQGRVHLVQDAEGGGADPQDGEDEGQGRQGALPTGEEGQALRAFARRPGQDLHPCVDDVFRVREGELGRAAVEKGLEEAHELLGDGLEGAPQLHLHALVQLPDDLAQVRGRGLQVLGLGDEELVPAGRLLVLPGRVRVHVAQPPQPGPHLPHLLIQARGQLGEHRQLGHHRAQGQGRLVGQALAGLHLGQAEVVGDLPAQVGQAVLGALELKPGLVPGHFVLAQQVLQVTFLRLRLFLGLLQPLELLGQGIDLGLKAPQLLAQPGLGLAQLLDAPGQLLGLSLQVGQPLLLGLDLVLDVAQSPALALQQGLLAAQMAQGLGRGGPQIRHLLQELVHALVRDAALRLDHRLLGLGLLGQELRELLLPPMLLLVQSGQGLLDALHALPLPAGPLLDLGQGQALLLQGPLLLLTLPGHLFQT